MDLQDVKPIKLVLEWKEYNIDNDRFYNTVTDNSGTEGQTADQLYAVNVQQNERYLLIY